MFHCPDDKVIFSFLNQSLQMYIMTDERHLDSVFSISFDCDDFQFECNIDAYQTPNTINFNSSECDGNMTVTKKHTEHGCCKEVFKLPVHERTTG